MFTDADRLAMIKSLGGRLVRYEGGEFWATFEKEFYQAAFGDGPAVESAQPALTDTRTIDVRQLAKDTPLRIDGEPEPYYIKRQQPDADGWTVILLKR